MILEKSFPAMGTVHTVTIFDAEGPEAASDARAYLLDLHGAWSCFMEDSLVSRINQAAGRQPVAVDEDTFEVLRQAKRYGRFTEGAFDVTVGPLADLWRRAMEERQLPGDKAVWQALALVNFANVTLDEEAHTVLLEKAGQRIDLGGIAKGYAVDELRKRLRRHGVHRALLDLGGTVAALGCGLPVGIRDPFRLHGAPMGTLMLEDRIAVTSGVYERFAYMDGYRYHHVVDPRTGYPSKSGLVSVTLVGENGVALDAFATAALILGMEKSAPMLAEQGMDAVFVTEHGQVFVTRGLKRQFHLHNTTNTAGAQMSVA